ncbi:hypothetical protein P700755_002729 [Psychroflexus torquis ATCC 700755]|uniref:Uncharacterized protein n=1 Tax=Psychroflexus torquis (strain ATCC 700755 / CIP 106069 / ACAM 623) TaxID=313595 RepID=K4IK51_PSYTT|nr:hypothetical protein P700755_002729 [Psychroflexus torquis ATCC 700755]
MRKCILYIALIASVIILISNIVKLDFDSLSNNSFGSIISSLIFSIVFIILIRNKNNHIEKEITVK